MDGIRGLEPERVEYADLTLQTFWDRFEKPSIPCVAVHSTEGWPAKQLWTMDRLREDYGQNRLKCGEDDEGYALKVKLETFARYQQSGCMQDDSPLYVFDSSYSKTCPDLKTHYQVPKMFPEDLFELVGDRRRPPHEWFLIGPERSGTCVHIDPLATSAWNTVLQGRKLWVMFSPNASRVTLKGKKYMKSGGDDEAVDWFADFLPEILDELPHDVTVYQFIQYPGDTVFVPHGWWHAVLNLDDTVAVTHNYVGTVNFEPAWRSVRVERKNMALKWLNSLRSARPDLYATAVALDRRDGYDLERMIHNRKRQKQEEKEKEIHRSKTDS